MNEHYFTRSLPRQTVDSPTRARRGERRSSRKEAVAARHACRSVDAEVMLRLDRVGESSSLRGLAALNEQPLPIGPFVVAEVDGRLVAARSLVDGGVLTDPFVATAHLRPILELRAAQILGGEARPRRLRLLPPRSR